jgi:hypothetical protein
MRIVRCSTVLLCFTWALPVAGADNAQPATIAAPAPAPTAKEPFVRLTNFRELREKNSISEASYESAMRDLADSVGALAAESNTMMVGKWATTMYGFVEADNIYDSTQSLNDIPGNTVLARPDRYAGQHDRFMMGVRNSRIGFRLAAPEYHGVRASAMLEMDFLGTPNPNDGTTAGFWTSPLFRVRHMNLKLETPVVDVLFGQYWQLFGWQPNYHPNTVEIQGIPGQIYSRTPQIRISKTIKTDPINLEIAAAMMRSPQRDSGTPEGQFGMRLAINKWTGMQTAGSAGSGFAPASIGVSGTLRHFSVNELAANPLNSRDANGWGVAFNLFLPIIPAKPGKRANSLSFKGEFANGYSTADLYTSLNGGLAMPTTVPGTMPAAAYTANVDPGLVGFRPDGTLETIHWRSWLFGLEYYLPWLEGRTWISGTFTHLESDNSKDFGTAANANSVRRFIEWWDVNYFADITPAVRLGFEYAHFHDWFLNGVNQVNHRFQFSAFYIF